MLYGPNKHVFSAQNFNKKVPNSYEKDICVTETKDRFFNIDLTHFKGVTLKV